MGIPGCQRSQTVSWAKHSGRWVPSLTHVSTWSGPSSFALPIRRRSHLIEGLARDDEVCVIVGAFPDALDTWLPGASRFIAGQALGRARNMGLAFTTAFALDGEALLGALGADPKRAAVHADEALAHSVEHNSRTMSRGHVSFRAPCWPKAVIPNMGLKVCTAPLQRSSPPIA